MSSKRFTTTSRARAFAAVVAVALLAVAVPAENGKPEVKAARSAVDAKAAALRRLSPTRRASVQAAEELKVKLAVELEALRATAAPTLAEVEKHERLLPMGLTSRKALDDARAAAEAATRGADAVAREIEATEHLIAELMTPDPVVARSRAWPGVMRGGGSWSLANASLVDTFFRSRFGRALPVSAFGQSAVHTKLRYDHSNAVDVPLHPDSAEGQALLDFLRQQGIPFLAFRGAIPGVATGAHIHIGRPSARF